jgi:pimeloyl-ACP methyl ester carboxylesterase
MTQTTDSNTGSSSVTSSPRRTIRRPLLRVLVICSLSLVGFLLLGLSYQAIASALDASRYAPPGKLVDIGGYRLHINCTGTGSPTVILDAGLGGTSLDWSKIQPAVARFTRVCSYDRAGYGWSDTGPGPRTSQQIVKELHLLLIVLSQDYSQDRSPQGEQTAATWDALQQDLASLSSNSQHSVAAHSGHYIQLDRPDLAIAAIQSVWQQAR